MAEREIAPGHDACGGLLGCSGGDDRRYMVEAEAVDAALTPRSRSWRWAEVASSPRPSA